MALISAHTSSAPLRSKNLKSKISSWKTETPDFAFGVVLKTLKMSPFAVAYHPLDGILNLCTKFEVLSYTKYKFKEWVPKYKSCSNDHVTRSFCGNSLFAVKYLSWSTHTPNLKCLAPILETQTQRWLGGLLVERRTSVSQIHGSIPGQVAAVQKPWASFSHLAAM